MLPKAGAVKSFKAPVDVYHVSGIINSMIFNVFLKCPIANIARLGKVSDLPLKIK